VSLVVCPLHDVADQLVRRRPARVISLLAPDQAGPDLPAGLPSLTLRFHDIDAPRAGLTAPSRAMVADLLAFARDWREPGPLLVHCWMGISRSTAAALVIACALDETEDEIKIAGALRRASPTATPNALIVSLADDLLARGGRLTAAAAAMGRGREAPHGQPFELSMRRPLR
jgi:predicted protein tyrosine phosphatase